MDFRHSGKTMLNESIKIRYLQTSNDMEPNIVEFPADKPQNLRLRTHFETAQLLLMSHSTVDRRRVPDYSQPGPVKLRTTQNERLSGCRYSNERTDSTAAHERSKLTRIARVNTYTTPPALQSGRCRRLHRRRHIESASHVRSENRFHTVIKTSRLTGDSIPTGSA